MGSENLERIYYTLEQQGRYYVINKMKTSLTESIKDDEFDEFGQTREGETAVSVGSSAMPQGEILQQYLYPIINSYVQSIVKEDENSNKRLFGLLLINSLSRGTFVFSADGLNNGEYFDKNMGVPYNYKTLFELFVLGRQSSFIDDGVKFEGDIKVTDNI